MKKILIILLLLTGTASAADGFLDSLNNISSAVKRNLNFDTTSAGADTATITQNIREAYSILSPILAARSVRDTILTVRNQADYNLDSTMLEVSKVYLHHADTLLGMKHISSSNWDTITIYGSGYTLKGKTGILSHSPFYDWVPGRITLYPVPYNNNDTIIIDGTAIPDNIMSDNGFPGDFETAYRVLFTYLATSLTAKAFGMDDDANYYYGIFKDMAQPLGITIGIKNE